jgi:hypothetical protein
LLGARAHRERNGLSVAPQIGVTDGYAKRLVGLEMLDNNVPGTRASFPLRRCDKGKTPATSSRLARLRHVTPGVGRNVGAGGGDPTSTRGRRRIPATGQVAPRPHPSEGPDKDRQWIALHAAA